MKTTPPLIPEDHRLIGATYRSGRSIRIYDDGFGPLFVFSQTFGPRAIVRAQTWEAAWEICEDEFFDEASESVDELIGMYNETRKIVRIIRDPNAPKGEREIKDSDYIDGKLPDGLFLRWETIETKVDHEEEQVWMDNELFCEAYDFRPNGPNARDVHKHGIYQKDLNGDHLEELNPHLISELGITLQTEPWE